MDEKEGVEQFSFLFSFEKVKVNKTTRVILAQCLINVINIYVFC